MNDMSEVPKLWSEAQLPLTAYDPPLPLVVEEEPKIWPRVFVLTILSTITLGVAMYLLFESGIRHLLYLASQ